MTPLLDVCWYMIVGRGKVNHRGWRHGRREFHLFSLRHVALGISSACVISDSVPTFWIPRETTSVTVILLKRYPFIRYVMYGTG